MKTYLIYIFVFTLFLNSSAQNTSKWEILNEGKGPFGIDFVSDDVGYMVANGSLLKTVDGGESWDFVLKIANTVYCLNFTSEYNGWVVKSMGYGTGSVEIAKTTDGGNTWQVQKETKDYDLRSMHVLTDSIVFAWESRLITRTTDGGKNWTDIETPADSLYYSSVWFFNADSGIALCGLKNSNYIGYIFKTFDAGQHWIKIQTPVYKNLQSLKFINDSTGYFYTSDSICITTDTLRTWTAYKNEYSPYTMIDENTIVAVNRESNLVYSEDRGETWRILNTPAECGYPRIIYVNSAHDLYLTSHASSCWDCETFTSLWKSTDLGENWQLLIFSYPFNDVFFTDKQKGFLAYASYDGAIFTTNDGGMTWKKHIEPGYIKTCFFTDEGTGYFLSSTSNYYFTRNYCKIFKSLDYGKNWFDVFINNPDSIGYWFDGKDLDFLNEDLGWAVGAFDSVDLDISGACILETTDGAENWHKVWDNGIITEWNAYSLNSIYACDSTAWAVGNDGLMVKYTLQDQWQTQPSVSDLPLNKVFFSDEDHGWIVGGNYYWREQEVEFYSILLKTTDGGNSWKEIRFDKDIIYDMCFADSLHGWAVGCDTTRSYLGYYSGIILETFDGGENWLPVVENLSAPLKAIHFKDGYGWAVGDNGLILKTEDGSTWIDQKSGEKYPDKFSLSQNYPNPFNPSTTIEFQIPSSQFVTLKIYNLLGQEVATLVNKKQPAGSYSVEWDASGFASGVYIYELKTSVGFKKMRKLLLLK